MVQVDGWGRDKFMSVEELLHPDKGFCKDDCVIFRVEMTVYGELELVTNENTTSRSVTLSQSFRTMLAFPVHTDVTFCVGDPPETILANKCVLMARSPVFYAMFSHDMKENVCGEVHVSDFEIAVVREFVHFIYTDSLSSSGSAVPHHDLLRIACKYQVPGLMSLCEELFIANMNADTVVPVLQMAHDYGALHLKITCLQFIARTPLEVTKQTVFHELDAALVKEAMTLIDAVEKGKRGVHRSVPSSSSLADTNRQNHSTCIVM